VERELGRLGGGEVRVTFTAQVVPVCRGILSSLYGQLVRDVRREELIELYREFYRHDRFVRVFDRTAAIGTIHVRGTNYCNLIVDLDERTRKLRIISHIDNLMKGQAGSALQNMNLLFGLPEEMGLNRVGLYP
jgi:N-acetyl-gamma-glutamyl-phosphate reductase